MNVYVSMGVTPPKGLPSGVKSAPADASKASSAAPGTRKTPRTLHKRRTERIGEDAS
jgi:hypothetical protein